MLIVTPIPFTIRLGLMPFALTPKAFPDKALENAVQDMAVAVILARTIAGSAGFIVFIHKTFTPFSISVGVIWRGSKGRLKRGLLPSDIEYSFYCLPVQAYPARYCIAEQVSTQAQVELREGHCLQSVLDFGRTTSG